MAEENFEAEMTANTEAYKKITRQKIYKSIRQDLLDQLDRNCTDGKYHENLVEDYMSLWVTKTLLQEDIKERGVRVFYNNGGGQCGFRKNDSVDQVLRVSLQMLKLLDALKIQASQGGEVDEDEEM